MLTPLSAVTILGVRMVAINVLARAYGSIGGWRGCVVLIGALLQWALYG